MTLVPHEIDTVNLRDVFGRKEMGYVAIVPNPVEIPLGGDFVRVDTSRATASGGLLVPARGMCREWSTRFLNGGPLEASTEFLFFAPGNGAGAPVAMGRVFNEQGQFVQEIKITNTEESFRIKTSDTFDDQPLLAGLGTIEWTFREGIAGHVAAVHKEKGEDEVAVPGFCRDAHAAEETSTLILPWFKVNKEAGLTTLLTVRNETEVNTTFTVDVGLVSAGGFSIAPAATYDLAGHAIRTVNLRDPFVIAEGFVRVTAPQSLSGDFIHVDPLNGRTGGALARSSQLCRCWDVRFKQDSPSTETDLLFYVEGQGNGGVEGQGNERMGTVYDEGGTEQGTVEIPSGASFLVSLSELTMKPPGGKVTGTGAIELDLGENSVGYVAALLREKGYSVLVPGLCRTPCP